MDRFVSDFTFVHAARLSHRCCGISRPGCCSGGGLFCRGAWSSFRRIGLLQVTVVASPQPQRCAACSGKHSTFKGYRPDPLESFFGLELARAVYGSALRKKLVEHTHHGRLVRCGVPVAWLALYIMLLRLPHHVTCRESNERIHERIRAHTEQ
ncbi:hypothetical protein OE88DRAFT_890646 [Heliocybe sulcata]|uniref:Uncharacterized protein n=1 Tax=Heliocybe sulcata TaxID=5364 RepID=A0A5C3MP23_9AGAM|nr:hypothetical protein OE88DRAFT_890646 [Heliocybe sulcata]